MKPTKVLIVDDRPENIFALSQLIQSDDIEIFSARDADSALDLVVSHDFGLALMDVQMPNISGFQLARIIRGVKRCRNLPMIFLTAHQRDDLFVLEGYETGAVDLLFKPLDPNVVRSKVRVFVQMDRQNQLLQTQMGELERLRAEAESANLAKSRFLANMSHEIRTPLSAVMGFADVLAQDKFSAEERDDCIAAIRRNGQQLLRLIDDILDISKVEAHHLEIDNQVFDFQQVIKDVGSTLSLKAEEKKVSLEFVNELIGPTIFNSDVVRIKQTLFNIIGNAIKFTNEGSVRVAISNRPIDTAKPDQAALQRISVRIKDSGIGLDPDQSARLFQPFSQADASTRRSYGGTGLGLVISRQIAKLLGGDLILLHSASGVGSEFELSFVIPLADSTAFAHYKKILAPPTEKTTVNFTNEAFPASTTSTASSKSAELMAISEKHILVVDDVRDNRILIERILKPAGVRVSSVNSGAEAIDFAQNGKPDLILMDIQMPEMDGFEATQKIRSNGFRGPIIAVTAHAMKEERQRCLDSGCNWVLTKPLNRVELFQTISSTLATT